jgi:hypothetical protein
MLRMRGHSYSTGCRLKKLRSLSLRFLLGNP